MSRVSSYIEIFFRYICNVSIVSCYIEKGYLDTIVPSPFLYPFLGIIVKFKNWMQSSRKFRYKWMTDWGWEGLINVTSVISQM